MIAIRGFANFALLATCRPPYLTFPCIAEFVFLDGFANIALSAGDFVFFWPAVLRLRLRKICARYASLVSLLCGFCAIYYAPEVQHQVDQSQVCSLFCGSARFGLIFAPNTPGLSA